MKHGKWIYEKILIGFSKSDLELIEAVCTRTHLSKAEVVRRCVRGQLNMEIDTVKYIETINSYINNIISFHEFKEQFYNLFYEDFSRLPGKEWQLLMNLYQKLFDGNPESTNTKYFAELTLRQLENNNV